jgi:hypothetical protein
MGHYEQMDFADSFSDPYEQPEFDRELGHKKLEKIYGL